MICSFEPFWKVWYGTWCRTPLMVRYKPVQTVLLLTSQIIIIYIGL